MLVINDVSNLNELLNELLDKKILKKEDDNYSLIKPKLKVEIQKIFEKFLLLNFDTFK